MFKVIRSSTFLYTPVYCHFFILPRPKSNSTGFADAAYLMQTTEVIVIVLTENF